MDKTLALIKPDGVQRGLSGQIISKIEAKGLKIVGVKMIQMDSELAKSHYADHVEKPFFPTLMEFITSGPIIALALEGPNCVQALRNLMGATNPIEATPGSIRGDLGLSVGNNLIHGSDSEESATKELNIFFKENELFTYKRNIDDWIIES
ncbi:MAG: nucleoside-diphosphate kinase [SAR202 cluster bacterium]|nr:nucleoside-diphosphate kinase [SAR202 cluster bacterium]|tara:strand:+ start:11885 stop:12337 length:453 start_codon:yes stop_codon:yes gene_type:complete